MGRWLEGRRKEGREFSANFTGDLLKVNDGRREARCVRSGSSSSSVVASG